MLLLACLTLIGHPAPGPLDAFRANFGAIRVDIDYVHTHGTADPRSLGPDGIWAGRIVDFVEDRSFQILGRWEFDGTVERYACRSPEDVLVESRKIQGGELKPFSREPFELIFDGSTAASHTIKGQSVHPLSYVVGVATTNSPGRIITTGGPFYWWGLYRFPIGLDAEFPGVVPTRSTSTINGRRTEVEVYRQTVRPYTTEEIHFDPAIGYLPRYNRIYSFTPETRRGYVKEMYMIEARPCAAGGVVPTEWIETAFIVDQFPDRYPEPDLSTVFKPTAARIGLRHYKATRVADRKDPVRLIQLDGVKIVSSEGGFVQLPHEPHSLSMAEVKAILGKRLTNPQPPALPHPDFAEMKRFAVTSRPEGSSAPWYLAIAATVAVVGGCLFVRKRHRSALPVALIAATLATGCRRDDAPVYRLQASLSESSILYEAGSPNLQSTLIVKNAGNRPVRIFQVDGGCSCRKIDQSPLPLTLEPAGTARLDLRVLDDLQFKPRTLSFVATTDQGKMDVSTSLLALPRHHLNPSSISLGIIQDEADGGFDVVHRRVGRKGEAARSTRVVFPPELRAEQAGVESGTIDPAGEFSYVDTTYRVSLAEHGLGLKKSLITLQDGGEKPIAVSTVVWQRTPFLSSIPDRVALSPQPLRVFLRCPETTVELTRVLRTPPGIRAFVSSPRELTIARDDQAPRVIDGEVEVGTTASGRGNLHIPVVCYAAASASETTEALDDRPRR